MNDSMPFFLISHCIVASSYPKQLFIENLYKVPETGLVLQTPPQWIGLFASLNTPSSLWPWSLCVCCSLYLTCFPSFLYFLLSHLRDVNVNVISLEAFLYNVTQNIHWPLLQHPICFLHSTFHSLLCLCIFLTISFPAPLKYKFLQCRDPVPWIYFFKDPE